MEVGGCMTQDEIIEMARQAGAKQMVSSLTHPNGPVTALKFDLDSQAIEAFAKLVAEAEREACAKEAEDSDHVVGGRGYYDQLGDADATVRNIVAAIRARRRA